MNGEVLQQAWQWLMSLSKVQLIVLGGGFALMIAVSKIIRVLFLLSVVVLSLVFGLPHAIRYYKENSLLESVRTLFYQDIEAIKDASSVEDASSTDKESAE